MSSHPLLVSGISSSCLRHPGFGLHLHEGRSDISQTFARLFVFTSCLTGILFLIFFFFKTTFLVPEDLTDKL